MNPGACVFSFLNTSTMTVKCTDETSNTSSMIPADLLTSSYMSNITRVTFSSLLSSLPSYLCSLPSHQIDLSSQAFTTLSDATFPCLDWFTKVSLSSNMITSVNMASGNFTNLTSLDLSSNQLTMLPYSILNPTPTSLRYLDLRNNDITYLDLFIYTLKNITINLDNNPINSSDILNPQNVTLPTGLQNGTSNITFPGSVTNSTVIIQDTLAVTYGLCNSFQTLRSYLLTFRLTVTNVLLDCTCASFNLRQIYTINGYNITSDFNCSIATQAASFAALTASSCPNATNFTSGLCGNSSNQVCPLFLKLHKREYTKRLCTCNRPKYPSIRF
jgi:Leucine-rich repeat (LRR) protein